MDLGMEVPRGRARRAQLMQSLLLLGRVTIWSRRQLLEFDKGVDVFAAAVAAPAMKALNHFNSITTPDFGSSTPASKGNDWRLGSVGALPSWLSISYLQPNGRFVPLHFAVMIAFLHPSSPWTKAMIRLKQ